MPRLAKQLLVGAGWLAIYGLAWTAGMAYIATVNTRDAWREWVTA